MSKISASLLSCTLIVLGTACGAPKEVQRSLLNGKEISGVEDTDDVFVKEETYTTDSGEILPVVRLHGSFISPDSFRQMVERSSVIVIGEPLESIEQSEVRLTRTIPDGSFGEAFSVTKFRIDKSLTGEFQDGDTIDIGQSVAILSAKDIGMSENQGSEDLELFSFARENYLPIKAGSKYILFLGRGLAQGSDVFFTVGNSIGRVNVDGTDELAINSPEEQKIRSYAVALYQAAIQNQGQGQNLVETIVEESDLDFPRLPIEDIGAERLPSNIPNVGVEPALQETEILPPANQR